jgi:hypothetical protein
LDDIRRAITKVTTGHAAGYGAIKFRPEQEKAIHDTVEHFKKTNGKEFLWNAKMRFGKTLSGLEVARRMEYKSTLIITHRPVVDKGWHDDFKKIFGKLNDYAYATRMSDEDSSGGDFYSLTKEVNAGKKRLVFFVSMQYLRLSQYVGGKEHHLDPLKKAIMQYNWDFVMVDEAHEGIESAAGDRVMAKLKKENTRILSLSGTPFNLLDKYEEGEIYTWDYVMEQKAKQEWDDKHFGDPNPYADLPRMQILTFTLPKMVGDEIRENNEVFRFHEFFRVWAKEDKEALQNSIKYETNPVRLAELKAQLESFKEGKFVHEDAVRSFVKKLRTNSDRTLYPFSTKEFRKRFRHTFWLLPGVKEAAAFYDILDADAKFGDKSIFHIINAAGDGNIEDKDGSALAEVLDNIRGNQAKGIQAKKNTITLSCGKLTTGVSVPEWTAVLCMKGSENTPAANYMQTIFRVQTHATLDGRQKSDCYVFDFAPDRALTAVAETAKMAVYAQGDKGKKQLKLTQKKEEEHLAAFIKLCPVLSMDEGEMGKHFSANQIFEKLNNVYIERAVRSGYADNSLYNPEKLMNLTPEQEKALGDVHDLLGSMPAGWKPEKININKNGLGNVEGADQIKYIYYLTDKDKVPATPSMADELDADGCPTTEDDGWDDTMNSPSALFPYLFISNSRLVNNEWSPFSKPVLWRQYVDKDSPENAEKKKRDEENKEKRARMSVLRGVAIRIPLLVYGAEINDDAGEEITIDNFADDNIVDQASWDEFMPKGFTKDTFNILKECFDRSIFTGAAKRIRAMVKEADSLNTEDRIAKIATIFSYFHNPDKETVLTPWRVVNMHMSDCLGGWCFLNDQFDGDYTIENEYGEIVKAARFVDRGQVTKDIFEDYNARILELNSKTGLYPLYMAYSLFKSAKEPEWRKIQLTGERGHNSDAEQYDNQAGNDLLIWRDVLQDNIFVVCRTRMAVSITKRTLAGFRKDIRMNVVYYERDIDGNKLDLIEILRKNPDLFLQDIVKGHDFWHVYNSIPKSKNEDINNMKFSAIVGNPPYQIMDGGTDRGALPVYNKFVELAKMASPDYISMIMPARWYAGGRGLDTFRTAMLNDTHMLHLYDFELTKTIFPTVDIAGGICYFTWSSKYNGKCYVHNTEATSAKVCQRSLNEFDVFVRSNAAISVLSKIKVKSSNYLNELVLSINPFGFRTYYRGRNDEQKGDIKILTSEGWGYVSRSEVSKSTDLIDQYKIIVGRFVPSNGEMNVKPGEGYRVITTPKIIYPGEINTETYIDTASLKTLEEATNYVSYLCCKFTRFLLRQAVTSVNVTRECFSFVPLQDFTSNSDIDWAKPVSEIDKQLYKKYGLSTEEQEFIELMIKPID